IQGRQRCAQDQAVPALAGACRSALRRVLRGGGRDIGLVGRGCNSHRVIVGNKAEVATARMAGDNCGMTNNAPARIWHPDGWRTGPRPAIDTPAVQRVIPGIASLHSHAFQRAMAGMAESQTHPEDSFWTWRETMYRFADRFTPESLHAVATQLYAEMLEAGYTTVCEFHYLHHGPGGAPYADPAAMSWALVEAAAEVGIRLTLLPVLYMTGGFDGRPLDARQQRFGHNVDAYLRLLDSLRAKENARFRVGCALHSLRAVPEDALRQVVDALPADSRIHIHIAEQVAEVEECVRLRGVRPVQWLLDHAPV